MITPAPTFADLKPEEKTEIQKLQKVSREMVKTDIQMATPEVYKLLQNQKAANIEEISQVMIQALSKKAPKGSSKPSLSDFEDSGDIYKKYFKPAE